MTGSHWLLEVSDWESFSAGVIHSYDTGHDVSTRLDTTYVRSNQLGRTQARAQPVGWGVGGSGEGGQGVRQAARSESAGETSLDSVAPATQPAAVALVDEEGAISPCLIDILTRSGSNFA